LGSSDDGLTALDDALVLEPMGSVDYACSLLPEWCHGPGVYGGLQAALLLEAMRLHVAEPARQPRSLTAQFIAPASSGPGTLTVDVIRKGRSMTHMAASLHRGDKVFARATATFAHTRATQPYNRQPAMPDVPGWDELTDCQHGDRPPTFLKMLRFRDCLGSRPYSGAHDAHLGGWGRFVHPTALTPASITALIDAWPPAVLACYPHMERAASVELSLTLHTAAHNDIAPIDVPVLYESRSDAISDGFSEEHARLWSPQGQVLATVMQRIIVFD